MSTENFPQVMQSLDSYLERHGKQEIDEIEANTELNRLGLMEDDQMHPGRPLRELLTWLRDHNKLPRNIRQILGSWHIKNSKAFQMRQQFTSPNFF